MACSVGFMKMLECHVKKCSKEACGSTEATRPTRTKVTILAARKAAKRIEIQCKTEIKSCEMALAARVI